MQVSYRLADNGYVKRTNIHSECGLVQGQWLLHEVKRDMRTPSVMHSSTLDEDACAHWLSRKAKLDL